MLNCGDLIKATGGRLISGPVRIRVNGFSIDSRTIRPGQVFIAIRGKNFDGHDFIAAAIKKGASCIIREGRCPGKTAVPNAAAVIEVKDTLRALGDIANFMRRKFNLPVVAVTGSNGKTTCKEMIAWVLSQRFKVLKNEGTKNNQVGLPLTLLGLTPDHDIAVLELGTNHFGEIDYLGRICEPTVGIITNIGYSHLGFLGSREGVFKEKYSLIKDLKKPALTILNADDEFLGSRLFRKGQSRPALGIGIKNRSDFFASHISYRSRGLEFILNQKYRFKLKTLGYNNIYNALAAIAVACIFGMGFEDMASRLAGFEFPQGRLKVKRLNGILFIDDTYNSNPSSLRQGLDVLGNFRTGGRKILVMGDMLELGKSEELFHIQAGKEAAVVCDVLVTVGKLSRLAARAAGESGLDIKNMFSCRCAREAGKILRNKLSLKNDDVVLVKGSRGMKMEEVFA